MKGRYFSNKPRFLFIVFAIATASLTVRLMLDYDFDQSALLYVGIPFAIAVLLILLRSPVENVSWLRMYLNWVIDALIIMLGSSIVLFEGFLCVVMFMPIYFFVLLVIFLFDYMIRRRRANGQNSLYMHIFPLLILFSSVEGVAPQTSLERDEQVSVTRVVNADIATIKQRLQRPLDLQKPRHWFLQMFPMPYDIQAGSLNKGDVHRIHFRYHRWFVTNTHEGSMSLQIADVSDERIKTTILDDTSYIANYIRFKGTEILLQPIDAHHTRVSLSVNYERKLDPYWYFSPLTRFGVSRMAGFLVQEMITNENS